MEEIKEVRKIKQSIQKKRGSILYKELHESINILLNDIDQGMDIILKDEHYNHIDQNLVMCFFQMKQV